MAPVILVDWSQAEPVYAQIARQVRAQIASGALETGSLLPSVRTLASDLGVNLNTVARAYRLLAAEGFVSSEAREGVRVVAPARKVERTTLDALNDEMTAVLARMRQAGMSSADIRKRVERVLEQMI
ncbi:MAG: GntR family transcriptional regulator [Bacteroidales bacterium]